MNTNRDRGLRVRLLLKAFKRHKIPLTRLDIQRHCSAQLRVLLREIPRLVALPVSNFIDEFDWNSVELQLNTGEREGVNVPRAPQQHGLCFMPVKAKVVA